MPRWLAHFIWLTALSTPATAEEPDFVDRLQARYDRLQDLRAEFVQVYHSGALGAEEPESGRLVAAKPGRMRWEYQSPEPKMAVVDGEWAWIYYVDEGEIDCHRLEGPLEGSPLAALLSGSVDLREEFVIEVGSVEDGQRLVRLRPRELSEDFEEVVLTVHDEDLTPRRLEVIDPVGSRQEFRFDKVRENQGVDDETFMPRLPRDVVWNGECPPWRRVGPG